MKEIHWNQAIEDQKAQKIEQEQQQTEYKENLQLAYDELMARMGSIRYSSEDFYDVCVMYGVDQDDLINRMI